MLSKTPRYEEINDTQIYMRGPSGRLKNLCGQKAGRTAKNPTGQKSAHFLFTLWQKCIRRERFWGQCFRCHPMFVDLYSIQ